MNKPDDYLIREQALNPRESYIVQAPAGSGKTSLLTQRLLLLLANVEREPEECLAITFTRKAAAEMQDRVLEALHFAKEKKEKPADAHLQTLWELGTGLLERDKAEGWNLIENPARLKIQTIDAFCASLTRQIPLMAGFGVFPEVIDDPKLLYEEAVSDFLQRLESEDSTGQQILELLDHLDNHLETAHRLLVELLAVREQWLPSIGVTRTIQKENQAARELLEQGLQTAIRDTLITAVNSIPKKFVEVEELMSLARLAGETVLQQSRGLEGEGYSSGSKNEGEGYNKITVCRELTNDWPSEKLEDLEKWQALADLLLTEKNSFRKTLTIHQGFPSASNLKNKEEKVFFQTSKKRMLELIQKLQETAPDFSLSLQSIRECPPKHYTDAEWTILACLVDLLPLLVAHLSLVFQKTGQVDFAEVSLAASRSLGDFENPSDLAFALDYQIRHILVDEFQDISIPQLKLLEQLTTTWQVGDGRSLFFVGDPQQSIYRFRQAMVGLFLQVKERGLNHLPLKFLQLTTNFRSHPLVIDWINKKFNILFPKQDNFLAGTIALCPSKPSPKYFNNKITDEDNKTIDLEHSKQEAVEVQNFFVTPEEEATQVVELIRSAMKQDPRGSIALLVRSRSQLKAIIPVLNAEKISYQGLEIERIEEHFVAEELFSLISALFHLDDRLAWLSILRSSLVGLSLEDLWVIANHEKEGPIWGTLNSLEKIKGLSQLAIEKLKPFIAIMESTLEDKGRYPVSIWIERCWGALMALNEQSEARIYDQNEQAVLDSVFALLDKEGYGQSLYDLEFLQRKLKSLYLTTNHSQDTQEEQRDAAVQIMTIHKSKGLEFDTVIVVGVGRRTKSDTDKLLFWENRVSLAGDPYLLLAPLIRTEEEEKASSTITAYLKSENRKRATFEETRLLYVASTRAKKRLYWVERVENSHLLEIANSRVKEKEESIQVTVNDL